MGFIDHTFANRVGKGTHRAIEAYERYRDRYDHVLRCDIYRYFPAIDHAILKSDFRRRVSCPSTLALLDLIVDGSNPQEPVHLYFDGDDLFSPSRRRRGLPIGNLTSQFFANLYLDRFDHFATEVLRAPYVRYVDDFALFHDDPRVLAEWRGRMRALLVDRRLRLHPRKTFIVATADPAQFLGFELMPTVVAACPRTMCAASAIASVACATGGRRERSVPTMSMPASALGSLTPSMPIRGAYAMRSSGAAGSIRLMPLKPGRPLVAVSFVAALGTTIQRTSARPTATGTPPTIGTTTWASGRSHACRQS